jgi:O-methyltransferase involved in polyketide biosynthesis
MAYVEIDIRDAEALLA